MTNTLFNLDEYVIAPKPKQAQRWVLFYQYNGETYLGKRVFYPYGETGYEWIEESKTRKLPTRYKSMSTARRYANELNKRRTAAGLAAEITVGVKLWSGK